ncbi:2-hydroxyacyl-CoA dehydratase family protein [Acidaminococcus sp. NSJ-142]|jgi:(R)-2-hydroxyglutaryl-CoA dehydratase subunit beta|uniref:(R)-2-hydroxyglutaryl-CoA dehydratase subunit beta n=1 Tax=Acidaminococcus TaxID=904 RepID=UPI000CF8FCC4|nr:MULTISPECIES: (R)-2-hydroxyglutaryl-CoA dehydratase subunit beta [Acidaminococcus]MCD2435729.1 2-hydroxyacyl-CoA dehydratase family protein [Acidaminococcus hominis]
MAINTLIEEFKQIALNPKAQAAKYKAEGKKLIGCLPYYCPEELVYAADMVPMGVWGANGKTEVRSKEYCATFYCTLAQLSLEMLLDGTLDCLDGIITPVLCDTLRPMSQNFKVAMEGKMPVIFLAHPQVRQDVAGKQYTYDQYNNVKTHLEAICGHEIANDAILNAIKVYNASRKARREFCKLANEHCDVITASARSYVLQAAYFMLKDEYTAKLEQLNKELAATPVGKFDGHKILVSGITYNMPGILKALDDNKLAIAADDVAYESRSFAKDAPEDLDNGLQALAVQFGRQDNDVILYDPDYAKDARSEHVCKLAEESGAEGVVVFMMQFCDPEEMEYPDLKKALNKHHIPQIKVGVDQQTRDFGQAQTALEAFAESL